MGHNFTDEELEGLSESERAALEDDDGQDDTTVDDQGSLDDDGDDTGGTGDDGDDDGDDKGDDQQPATPPNPAANAAERTADQPPEFQPHHDAPPLEESRAKLDDISAKKSELRTKLNEGDIGLDEYTEQYDALSRDERQTERDMWRAEEAQKVEKQRWEWEQEKFFSAPENTIYKDKYALVALDTAVKDLARDPKNAGRPDGWFLTEADKLIRDRFNFGQPAKGQQNQRQNQQGRKDIPPTLSGMPAAEQPDVGGGDEFSHLDRLEGFDLEAALAKMTPEQQERYLQG